MKKTYLRKGTSREPRETLQKSGQGAKSFLRMSDSETKQRKKKKKSKKVLSEDSLEDFREKKAKRGVVRFFIYVSFSRNRRENEKEYKKKSKRILTHIAYLYHKKK